MAIVYDALLKVAQKRSNEPVYIRLDSSDKAKDMLVVMQNYVKTNAFTYVTQEGRFTISNIILRKRENAGKIIQDIPYCKLFDTVTDKLLKNIEIEV
jgi:hypothetical protein